MSSSLRQCTVLLDSVSEKKHLIRVLSPNPSKNYFWAPTTTLGYSLVTEWNRKPRFLGSSIVKINLDSINACRIVYLNDQWNWSKTARFEPPSLSRFINMLTLIHCGNPSPTSFDSRSYMDPNKDESKFSSWFELLDKIQAHYSWPKIATTSQLLSINQPKEIKRNISDILRSLDPFELSGFEYIVKNSKSIFLALALLSKKASPAEALSASLLENDIQASEWGILDEYRLFKSNLTCSINLGHVFMTSKTP